MASLVVDSDAIRRSMLEEILGQVAGGALAVVVDIDGNWLRFRRLSAELVAQCSRVDLVPVGVEHFIQSGQDWRIHIVTLRGEHFWTCGEGESFTVGFP